MKIDRKKGQKLDGNPWTMLNEQAKGEKLVRGGMLGIDDRSEALEMLRPEESPYRIDK